MLSTNVSDDPQGEFLKKTRLLSIIVGLSGLRSENNLNLSVCVESRFVTFFLQRQKKHRLLLMKLHQIFD